MSRLEPGGALGVADFWFGPRAERSKTRATVGLRSETVTMVTVARLTRRNGHLATLAALAKLHPSVRKRLTWLVVGPDGEDDYVDKLKAVIAASDCDVRLMGAVPTQQIRDVYGASDFFCLTVMWGPCRPAEASSLVYLEAAASGLPSIATAVSGVGDAVIDNETGRLVEPSTEAIAEAIVELTIDGIKRTSLGKRAWMRARAINRDLPNGPHFVRDLEGEHACSDVGAPR